MSTDLYCDGNDLIFQMIDVSGRTALSQAILRRLVTVPGDPLLGGDGLINFDSYGIGIRDLVNSTISAGQLRQLERRMERQLLRDDRIEDVTVTLAHDITLGLLTVDIAVIDSSGPFSLTIEVNDLSLELIRSTA